MSFKSSTELLGNHTVTWKKLDYGVPVLMGNIIQTGSTDGSGGGGQSPSSFTSRKTTIRFWAGGVEQSNRPITVWGFTDNTQGGFIPQYAEITEQGDNFAVNMHVRFRLAEYQGECGNVSIDGALNCAMVQTLAITGTPTGGHFNLTWNGVTTGNIAYNASAATVQTALAALAGRYGTVAVAGATALPTGTLTITYSNTGNTNVLNSTDAFTGGSSPASALTVTSWVNGANLFAGGYQVYASGTEAARVYIDTTWFWSGKQTSFVSLLPAA